ncbi:MAG: TraR/DksA C4-type zinc finger protein [Thermodesulfobacteriota bacterium]
MMNAYRIGVAEEGSRIKDQLTHILAGLSRKFYDDAAPIHSFDRQADTLDLAAAYRDRETSLRLLERERNLTQEILDALHRMETGRYGICENCGEQIGLGRLKVSPTTTLCIECKKERENSARKKTPSFGMVPSLPA